MNELYLKPMRVEQKSDAMRYWVIYTESNIGRPLALLSDNDMERFFEDYQRQKKEADKYREKTR